MARRQLLARPEATVGQVARHGTSAQYRCASIIRSRLRLVLDDHASVNQSLSRLLGQVQGKSCPLVGGHLRQAVRHRSGDVDLLTILPFVGLYAAAMRAVHEIASRPAPDENLPTPTAPARRGRPPRQPQPAPREAQAASGGTMAAMTATARQKKTGRARTNAQVG